MPTVLVIDDDPDVLRMVRIALEFAGYEAVTTGELQKVVPLAAAAKVKAVVLDVVMPGFSGYDALAALRRDPRTSSIPVLVLSGLKQGADRVRGLREGADDYLTKPFEPMELVLRVRRLVATGEAGGAARIDQDAEDLRGALALLESRRREGQALGEVSIGRYLATEVLGEGGMGTVLRGWDPKLQRPVALKTIRPDASQLAGHPSEMVHRLLLEAIMVAQVNHPNVVAVYDVGEARDVGFIAMELVEGTTLERHLARVGLLHQSQAVPLLAGILRGLAAAHAHGLVQHDVKPGNVLLGQGGAVKVTDFGVAGLMSSLARESRMTFGTPGYLPPEALRGEGYDERGDLFAAGVILYQCLTGERP